MQSKPVFQLPDPSYEAHTWLLQDEHGPTSVPPLLTSQRAHRQMSSDGNLPRAVTINGYTYARVTGDGSSRGPESAFGAFNPQSVDDMKLWRREWLTQVDAFVRELERFDPETVEAGTWQATLSAQAEEYQRVFQGVHRTAAISAGAVARRFTEAFENLFGRQKRGDALKLLQGFPNRSLDRAKALWDLSRLLRDHEDLLQAFNAGRDLPSTAPASAFKEQFAAMLDNYGFTSNAELEDLPTWSEDPSIPLAVIRGYALQSDERSPSEAHDGQRRQRLQLEGELRELASTNAAVAELVPLMEMAQQIVPNQEDHNLLVDQRMAAASRRRWLAVGCLLETRGALEDAADVFFLQLSEVISVLEDIDHSSLSEIAARKSLLRACRESVPPTVLGRPLQASNADSSEAAITELTVVRGVAASSGIVRGRARLIETLTQAGQLEAGDVLVCRTTTPSWTPFFGIISGLVTNSGGALSHGALVARELGLPAVVGTINATAKIRDGCIVTVDGTNGQVIVET